MLNFFKTLFPSHFKRKIKEDLGVPSLHWSLQNLKAKGFNPSFVLDIGAFEGEWTSDFLEVFPNTKVLMLEAQNSKREQLTNIIKKFNNVQFEIALLSSEDGKEVSFYENETASHIQLPIATIEPCEGTNFLTTHKVDTILNDIQFPLPDFLKLDVQGHELEVLKGARAALHHAEIVLLEISFLDLGDGTPLAIEVIQFMDNHNFQMYDITQFMRRPFDRALYQLDVMFIKKNSKLIAEKRWN